MFFANVLVSGLLAGLMYAMVAIGFVLIYKASGVSTDFRSGRRSRLRSL
jgi:branched-subunit amino acid ABC-type transport system permease component